MAGNLRLKKALVRLGAQGWEGKAVDRGGTARTSALREGDQQGRDGRRMSEKKVHGGRGDGGEEDARVGLV
jgi:hypothetical protein